MNLKKLQCSTCNYIPDQDDVDKTNYYLSDCSCGQKNVCDLCLFYSGSYSKENEGVKFLKEKAMCPSCKPDYPLRGVNRKFWLQEEYD